PDRLGLGHLRRDDWALLHALPALPEVPPRGRGERGEGDAVGDQARRARRPRRSGPRGELTPWMPPSTVPRRRGCSLSSATPPSWWRPRAACASRASPAWTPTAPFPSTG